MNTITVHTRQHNYDVRIQSGIFDKAGIHIAGVLGACRIMIVTDDTVQNLYGDRLIRSMRDAGIETEMFVFPHGEASKNMETLCMLLNSLAAHAFTRIDALCALGGGVVGDLTGFAAATYLRGIRYVSIPTTVLACVDSSVGGKTAVDLDAGKNLAGAFWQPSLVLCDPDTLSTLPHDFYADGMAEVIKYAIIADEALFNILRTPPETRSMEEIIARCVAVKARLVEEDEHDFGVRKYLNFGHTAGHAIEARSHFSIMHGHGVACGMMIAAHYAAAHSICPPDVPQTLAALLRMYDLPLASPFPADSLYEAATRDKKRNGGTIDLVLPTKIGGCTLHRIPMEELAVFLREGCAV